MKLYSILHHTQKLTQKWIKDLSVKLETVKLLAENIGGWLLDIGYTDDFLDLTPKAKATKAKMIKWEYIKLKRNSSGKKRKQSTK